MTTDQHRPSATMTDTSRDARAPGGVGIRCGDTVRHKQSQEVWIVAYADPVRDDLAYCGWPDGVARLSDCELIEAASDALHRGTLRDVLRSGGSRASNALRLYGDPDALQAAQPDPDGGVGDVRVAAVDLLARFRDFVVVNAKMWTREGGHHNPIWQEVANTIAAAPRPGDTVGARTDGGDREGAVTEGQAPLRTPIYDFTHEIAPPTAGPGDLEGLAEPSPEAVEMMAEHLHEEEENDHIWTWPTHSGDDGYRGGGYVTITPPDVQARLRDMARRILIRADQIGARSGDLVPRTATSTTRAGAVDREAVARIIDPLGWAGYDNHGSKVSLGDSLARADQILALVPQPLPADAGAEAIEKAVEAFRRSAMDAIQDLRHAAACNFTPAYSGSLGEARCNSFYEAAQAVKKLPPPPVAPPAAGGTRP